MRQSQAGLITLQIRIKKQVKIQYAWSIGSGTDSKSIAREFASKVREIFDSQSAIAGQGAKMSEKVQNVEDAKDVKNVGDVKDGK